jgi:hypothetical protein
VIQWLQQSPHLIPKFVMQMSVIAIRRNGGNPLACRY